MFNYYADMCNKKGDQLVHLGICAFSILFESM